MRRPVTGSLALYPLVTVSALYLALPAVAQPLPAAPAAMPAKLVWRTDYNSARREATEKGLPLIVVIGTQECFYCRKLEAGPLRDPAIVKLITTNYIPLKLDATRSPDLAKKLRVQMYPTTVLAGSDGKIHAFIEGFIEADRFGEQLKRTLNVVSTPDWAARDFNEASKALAGGDFPRAVTLLRGIVKEAASKPVGVKANELLAEVEKVAAGKLAQAKHLAQNGQTQQAMDILAGAVKQFAGTQAASDAAMMLAGLAEQPAELQKKRLQIARDLLALARDDFRSDRMYDCMQKCEQLTIGYPELAEAKDAAALLADIRGNPERLARACEQMNDRTAAMYLALAESWTKKGQTAEAESCLKKVMALSPNSRSAEVAQAELVKLQSKTPAVPTGLTKP